MTNLIITIISIALVAVAAAMGLFYGGTAYEQANINAMATGMINESQQVLLAMRTWALNNGQPDANTVPSGGGTNFGTLVSAGLLTGYPTGFAGMINASGPGLFGHYFPGNVFYGCSTMGNDGGWLIISMFTYHNGNYMLYNLHVGPGGSCVNNAGPKTANDSVTKFALSVNKNMGVVASSNLTMSTLGVPYAASYISDPSNLVSTDGSPLQDGPLGADANGNLLTNMCYFLNSNLGILYCVFGPS
jgi:hypothetical protein